MNGDDRGKVYLHLYIATSPFANHQPTTVPVWAQNSSLQTRLHMTFTSENYRGVNLLTYLLIFTGNMLYYASKTNVGDLKEVKLHS